ncbi:MAG: ParB/RepB/Spo0J family partition protein [Puniceicoccales bacterium]|jgi:ParB family chromosome partitioning protein|nr:ParB/RepB/Spo0J family partition protein [Puniceicoccales bacterium]
MSTPKKSLGRGLNTLISGGAKRGSKPVAPPPATPPPPAPPQALPYQELPVAKIVPARWQPRREFDDQALAQLADSIQAEGLLQPILVRATDEGYELIAGERRWRAYQKLALKAIPARILNASDAATAVMTLIENLQREGLNPIEEAIGYASLMRDFNHTQETVAERVGKPRATIANSVRLLTLNREIQGYLAKNMLTSGHAKVLLGLPTEGDQVQLARRIIETGASVREAEHLVRKHKSAAPVRPGGAPVSGTHHAAEITAAINDIERRLTTRLNTKVRVQHGPHKGRILIEYYNNEDLHRILEKLGAAT